MKLLVLRANLVEFSHLGASEDVNTDIHTGVALIAIWHSLQDFSDWGFTRAVTFFLARWTAKRAASSLRRTIRWAAALTFQRLAELLRAELPCGIPVGMGR